MEKAKPITKGVEDKFYYVISDDCVKCGLCAKRCPVGAISMGETRYEIDPEKCIDCGTCAYVCPKQAPAPLARERESISISDIDMDKCYYNPGCALPAYKPDAPAKILKMLQENFGDVKFHEICCRHEPNLPSGSVVIGNCAGCDRRFRSLYDGLETITLWEVLDGIEGLKLPDHSGKTVSIHDSCGVRHKPQVHRAIRSLLGKMNIRVEEAKYSGTNSVCCGDNFYGHVDNDVTSNRIDERVQQFPVDDVVCYCIGCVRAIEAGGKRPLYLIDLLLDKDTEAMPDTLDQYHDTLVAYIDEH